MIKILKSIKKSDWILIGLYYAIALPVRIMGNWSEAESHNTLNVILFYIADYVLDIAVLIVVVFFVFNTFFRQGKYVATFLFFLLTLIVQLFIQVLIFPYAYDPLVPDFWERLAEGIENNFEAVSGLTLLLIGKQYYESKNQIMQLEKQKKESELQLLKSQIDPHFLFNNLNILDILINIDPPKASLYTKRLSSLYRYMIRHKDQDVVSLKEEWTFSEDYIFLLQQRFDDLYLFDNQLDSGVLESYFIPPASMQTLLENIVKHNTALPDEPIKVKIYIENDLLCVENDYRPKEDVKDSTGTGLTNLKKRIQLLSDQTLIIDQNENKFLVKIPLVKLV